MGQVDRLQNMIETLLSVSRGSPAGEQTTDLVQAVREIEARWHGPLAQEGRPLHTIFAGGPAVSAISPAVLSEVLEVLVQNAAVHGAGAVRVVVRRVGDAFALDVSDQGPGFGPNVEEAFQRGSGEGHGIGLALARSLAHAEGARLQVTEPGPRPTVSLLIAAVKPPANP